MICSLGRVTTGTDIVCPYPNQPDACETCFNNPFGRDLIADRLSSVLEALKEEMPELKKHSDD